MTPKFKVGDEVILVDNRSRLVGDIEKGYVGKKARIEAIGKSITLRFPDRVWYATPDMILLVRSGLIPVTKKQVPHKRPSRRCARFHQRVVAGKSQKLLRKERFIINILTKMRKEGILLNESGRVFLPYALARYSEDARIIQKTKEAQEAVHQYLKQEGITPLKIGNELVYPLKKGKSIFFLCPGTLWGE